MLMERRSQTVQVNIRVPAGMLEKIDLDIDESQEFSSRADYILAALRHFDAYREELRKSRECDFAPSGSLQLRDEVKG